MKTEFFAAFDGVRAGVKDNKTDKSGRVLVIGATNRPEELDSAAIRKERVIFILPGFIPIFNRQNLRLRWTVWEFCR